MKPIWRRVGNEIVILASGREYRFNWQDADMATALYLSLLAENREDERDATNLR